VDPSAIRLEEKLGDWAGIETGAASRARDRKRAVGCMNVASMEREFPGD
jgi:hypothetical protein